MKAIIEKPHSINVTIEMTEHDLKLLMSAIGRTSVDKLMGIGLSREEAHTLHCLFHVLSRPGTERLQPC